MWVTIARLEISLESGKKCFENKKGITIQKEVMLLGSRNGYCCHGIMQFKGSNNLSCGGILLKYIYRFLFYSTRNKDMVSNHVVHTMNRVFFGLVKNISVKVTCFNTLLRVV